MKRTIIISAVALCTLIGTAYATPIDLTFKNAQVEANFKVNSFCISIAKGDLDTVKALLALGEDVNQKSDGMTPAMYAAKYNRTEILRLLIEGGCDLRIKSTKKMTALEYAKLHGATEAYQIIETALSQKK